MFNLLSGEYSVFYIARADFPAAAPHSVFFLRFADVKYFVRKR